MAKLTLEQELEQLKAEKAQLLARIEAQNNVPLTITPAKSGNGYLVLKGPFGTLAAGPAVFEYLRDHAEQVSTLLKAQVTEAVLAALRERRMAAKAAKRQVTA